MVCSRWCQGQASAKDAAAFLLVLCGGSSHHTMVLSHLLCCAVCCAARAAGRLSTASNRLGQQDSSRHTYERAAEAAAQRLRRGVRYKYQVSHVLLYRRIYRRVLHIFNLLGVVCFIPYMATRHGPSIRNKLATSSARGHGPAMHPARVSHAPLNGSEANPCCHSRCLPDYFNTLLLPCVLPAVPPHHCGVMG
jgi:hypothetical protein